LTIATQGASLGRAPPDKAQASTGEGMSGQTMALAALIAAALPTSAPARVAASTQAAPASQVTAAMDFLADLGRLDFDSAAARLDEDAVLDLPYVGEGLILRGRPNIAAFFQRSMGKSVSGIVYKLDRAYPDPQTGTVVLEISTQGRTAAGRN
jgi:hypothetical protein